MFKIQNIKSIWIEIGSTFDRKRNIILAYISSFFSIPFNSKVDSLFSDWLFNIEKNVHEN